MVTRLPGTFGRACEETGTTVSAKDFPEESDTAQSGSLADQAAANGGSVLPAIRASERPAMMAAMSGHLSCWIGGLNRIAAADMSILLARPGIGRYFLLKTSAGVDHATFSGCRPVAASRR